MTVERKDTEEEHQLYGEIGIVLYRIDKADPEVAEERAWKDARADYTRRARRLWKTMQRHGLEVVHVPVPPPE